MDWRPLSEAARKGRVMLSLDYGDGDPLVIGGQFKPVDHPQGLEWVLDNGHRLREDWIVAWAPVPQPSQGFGYTMFGLSPQPFANQWNAHLAGLVARFGVAEAA